MSKILITGGTGLIGSHVAASALTAGLTPVLFDAAPTQANLVGIAHRVVIEQGEIADIADLLRVVEEHGIDRVIHLAAILTIRSTLDPARAIAVNCLGTSNILQLAKLFGFRRVVYASSAAVYGTRGYYEQIFGRHKVTEDDPVKPYDFYGSTKQLCEGLAAQATRDGVDVVGLRPVMTFGYGRLDGAVGIVTKAMRDAAAQGRGIVTRPWQKDTMINPMYVKDCADIFVATLIAERKLKREVYNLGTGEYLSIREMMDLAEMAIGTGRRIDFEDVAPQEGGGRDTPVFDYPDLDSSALRDELGWKPRFGFEAGAADCIDAYRRAA